MADVGSSIYKLAERLWPLCRSITGDGVRETLKIIREIIPELEIYEVPSGTQCYDWTVPPEWNIRSGKIIDPNGEVIIDFARNNLHVVGYSKAIDAELPLEELQRHLHSLPEQPEAIPYVTSYYQENWGFCLKHRQRMALRPGVYRAIIDSELKPGSLSYGELRIEGKIRSEIFLSTYICHPSLGNNELSGPCVATHLARWMLDKKDRRHSIRMVFIPETIGAIVYLSKHLKELKERVCAGYVVTCVGDDRSYSYLASRNGNTLADRAAIHVLKHLAPLYKTYSYLDRGSDERQYCSPGVDLPVASIMRSKYNAYPEYHTSLDNLSLITPGGLFGGYSALQQAIITIELNMIPRAIVLGEPQLGKRGLYPGLGTKSNKMRTRQMMNLLAYSDGSRDLLAIAEIIEEPIWELRPICDELKNLGLLEF